MRVAAVALLLCTLLGTYAQPTQIVYQVGQTFVYSLTGTLDARGHTSDSSNAGDGTASTMVSTVAMKCTEVHPDYYVLVMNMFNTDVGVNGLDGSKAKNIKDSLGYDMYFQQLKTGEIPKVWYNTADSQYYVQVKLGAINAFQTRIVNNGEGLTALENDPVGSHYSHFQGLSAPNVALSIQKTFNQSSFQAFPDPAVTKTDVQISAISVAGIHSAGFIQTSTVSQTVNYVNSAPSLKNVYTGSNGVMDMNIASMGQLSITHAPALLQSVPALESSRTFADLTTSEDHFEKNLFEAAQHMFQLMEIESLFGVEEELEAIFVPSGSARPLARMDRVINILSRNPSAVSLELAPYFSSPLLLESKDFRDKLFYIASGVEGEAIDLMIKHALVSSDVTLQLHALFATSKVVAPSPALLTVTRKLLSSPDSLVANAALMSLGRLLGAMGESAAELVERLHDNDISPAEIIATLYAIKNAGPKAAPKTLFTPHLFSRLISHNHPQVREVSKQVLGEYVTDVSKFLVNDSDFPFNRSIGKNVTVGGSKVNGDFGVELFMGTNFDCTHQNFNYEALARANVELHLFGYSKEAFLAEVVYGKSNGMALADHVLVQVWNKVLYNQPLAQLDCTEHTKDIAHTEKGLSVSYTLWVSVIPVTFTAGGSLTLDLSWGWQICDSDLSALVELIPGGSLTIYGNAEINLLIIKAGLNLQGSFNTQIIPQAYVHGTQCQVGVDVRRVSVPMTITLDGYYAWKKCKLIIFDCKWGDHNEKVFASWNTPSVNTVLLDQHWDIKL